MNLSSLTSQNKEVKNFPLTLELSCCSVFAMTKTATATSDRAEKLDAALARLSSGVSAIRSSDDWKRVLSTAAKFPKYSFRNIMMIYMQRPDATCVAGFNTWKKLGRSVRKGEKGISIFAPIIVKRPNPETGKEESKLIGFRLVYTFDVSQTEGKDLPGAKALAKLEGDAPEMLLESVFDVVRSFGYSPSLIEREGSWHGMTNFRDQTVVVCNDLSPLHAVKTALHETGHVLAHDPKTENVPLSRAMREVEAESIAFLVASAFGLDTSEYSFEYVAGWADDEKAVMAMAGRILGFAKEILAKLDAFDTFSEPEEDAVAA